MQTTFTAASPQTVKRWSANLAIDTTDKGYFDRKFVGKSDDNVIQQLTDLESDQGDTIKFDLAMRLRQRPVTGDNRIEGKAERLKFYQDEVKIDQSRSPVSPGGRMTRKRTLHNLRAVAKDRLSDYWSAYIDQMHFCYLSGMRGINEDFIEPVDWTGHADNPFQAPDSGHILFAGAATSAGALAASDRMTRALIERASVRASMIAARDPQAASMLPVTVAGEKHYVCVMSDFQEHDLRTADTAGWIDIQKAKAAAVGNASEFFKGGLGMIKNVVLHAHSNAIRFMGGAGSAVACGRALFLGRQAGVVAYGMPGGGRFMWSEVPIDHGNDLEIAAGTIIGCKKTRFNDRDFGVISLDTAAADPN